MESTSKIISAWMCTLNDIDKYRLTSMDEPTDDMLAQLMHEAAVEATEANARVICLFFSSSQDNINNV